MSDNLSICLVSTGVAMPLLQFVLSEQPYKLSVAELKRLIVICGQEPERGRKKRGGLASAAAYISFPWH